MHHTHTHTPFLFNEPPLTNIISRSDVVVTNDVWKPASSCYPAVRCHNNEGNWRHWWQREKSHMGCYRSLIHQLTPDGRDIITFALRVKSVPCTALFPEDCVVRVKSADCWGIVWWSAIMCRIHNNHMLIIGSVCLCQAASVCSTVSTSINPLPSNRLHCCDRCPVSAVVGS